MKKRIAIFASGEGTNASALIEKFRGSGIEVVLLVTDNLDSNVEKIAIENNISFHFINKDTLKNDSETTIEILKKYNLDLIVLAGFMRIIPEYLIKEFPNKIVNIHPSIDKKHDKKTGKTIHDEVLKEAKEKLEGHDLFHGSRVHFVTTEVDGGETIDSESFKVDKAWTTDELLQVVKKVEHGLYFRAIQKVLNK